MFPSKILASILLTLSTVVNAASIPLEERGEGIVKLSFDIKYIPKGNNTAAPLQERDESGTSELTLHNKDTYYITDLYFGSNKQKLSVNVDTGSSDLWVIDSSANADVLYGSFDSSSSSTFKGSSAPFGVAYFDESLARGTWANDDVSLSPNGPTLKGFKFGDATQVSQLTYGILGIGLTGLESTSPSTYDNFPIALKKTGAIKKTAYSLYLNSKDSQTGSVLFGGIDNAKYSGDLVSFPLLDNDSRLTIKVDSISSKDQKQELDVGFTLDSGSTISYLEPSLLSELASKLGASPNGNDFYYFQTCDDVPDLTINFNGLDVTIPSEDLRLQLTNKYTGEPLALCGLAILPESRDNILGDNFLRHVYAVYDLEDKKISLANVKYSSDEDIVAIS